MINFLIKIFIQNIYIHAHNKKEITEIVYADDVIIGQYCCDDD